MATTRARCERRLAREHRVREALEQELSKFRDYCSAQEFEVQYLQGMLRKNGINYERVERPVMGKKIDVVVEVNTAAVCTSHSSGSAQQMQDSATDGHALVGDCNVLVHEAPSETTALVQDYNCGSSDEPGAGQSCSDATGAL